MSSFCSAGDGTIWLLIDQTTQNFRILERLTFALHTLEWTPAGLSGR